MINAQTMQKTQIAAMLLGQLGGTAWKADVLEPYGVTGFSGLTELQLDAVILRLRAALEKKQDPELKRRRSEVLYLLAEIGVAPVGKNWQPVNEFLKQPRIAGKVLYEMTGEELRACALRLRAAKPKMEEAKEVREYLERNN